MTRRSNVEIIDERGKNDDKIEDNYSNAKSKDDIHDMLDSIISKPNAHNTFDNTNKQSIDEFMKLTENKVISKTMVQNSNSSNWKKDDLYVNVEEQIRDYL